MPGTSDSTRYHHSQRKFKEASILFTILAVMMINSILGCGEAENSIENDAMSQDTLVVSVQNTIGVSVGDSNYVFGEILSVRERNTGEILVLDRIRMQLFEYDSDGSYIRSISREGSGPGELLNPTDFDIDSSGNLLVLDMMHGMMLKLTSSGEYICTMSSYNSLPPLKFELSSDTSYIPLLAEEDISEGGVLSIRAVLAGIRFGSDERIDYWENTSQLDLTAIENLYYATILSVAYDVDSQGNVYYAPSTTDYFRFVSCEPSGETRFEVSYDVNPILKSNEELYEEQAFIKCLARWFGGRIEHNFDPPPYRTSIIDIDVDCNDRIWVRNGLTTEPTFEVYSDSGDYLTTVTVQVPVECSHLIWDFEINKTILGFPVNPGNFHRLYLFGGVDILNQTAGSGP